MSSSISSQVLVSLPAQFITWHPVQLPTGKYDKIPVHPQTGAAISPLDPANWLTHDAAVATGRPVGFVFTRSDDYFLLDIDNCREGDGWSQRALDILGAFPGAAVEASYSGTGLHVIGRCDKSAVSGDTHKNKFDGLEFYTSERFVAFGPYGWQGNPDVDCTAALLRLVPRRLEPVAAVQAGTCPVPDDTALERLLKAKSGAVRFGGEGVTPRQLWDADAAVLARAFKPIGPGEPYDRSSADAALMAHLAFWTCRDAAAMDRLFRRSSLMRPKYDERADYRARTIDGAIGITPEVADWPAVAASAPGTDLSRVENLSIPDQREHFAGCTYVRSLHAVLVPDGGLLKPEQFNATYGGHRFVMSADNSQPTRKAFEAFTENRAHRFPRAERTGIRPDLPFGLIVDGVVNAYRPAGVERVEGDVSPFLSHLERLLPVASDRASLLMWMAALTQRPGRLIRWAPVIQGVEGNGKTFFATCMRSIIGDKYASELRPQTILKEHNGWLYEKLFVSVEEIDMRGSKYEMADILKPYLSNPYVEYRIMRTDAFTAPNVANWMLFTNHRGAVPKTDRERRYAIFHTVQQTFDDLARYGMVGDYFKRLYGWAEAGGYAAVADYLARLDISSLSGRAPHTSSTAEAIEDSRPADEQAVLDAIAENQPGFRNGWLSAHAVKRVLADAGLSISRRALGRIPQNLGYRKIMQAPTLIPHEGGARPIIYSKIDRRPEISDYLADQGYSARLTVVPQ